MFEPGWIMIGFIEKCLGDPKQFDPARLKPIPILYGTPNFPIFYNQTLNSCPSQTSMAATNMSEPGWIMIGFIEKCPGDPKQFDPARLKPIPILYGTPNFPIFYNQTINSSPSQTSMAATNMFEPGWILIGFIEKCLEDPKQFDPARLKPIPILYGTPKFPIFDNQTLNSCPSQTSMAATNMSEPGWIMIGFIEKCLEDPKQFDPARLKPIPILYGTSNFPIFYNQTLNSCPSQTSMAATNMFEPGWILIGFIEDRLGDPKLLNPARLKPIPILYGTPKFPIFYNQTLNSCPSQTSMAATNMFEPGWIMIGFIEECLEDPKQFDPARLKPIPIFYGTPNFPIFYNQTLNSCPSQTSMAATNMFEPGWILIGFIEDRLEDPKLLKPARLKPIPILYGTPNFPIFYNQTLNSCPSQTSMAATNMFEPGWILIGFIEDRLKDPKLFKPARLKPIPIFYGTPNFPIFYNQTLNSCPSQTSMAATNMFEPGWILIGFIEDRLWDPKLLNAARLKPIPILYGTPNFPIFYNQTLNSCPSQTSMAATNMFEPGWILIGFIENRLLDLKQFDPARLKPIPILYGTPNFPIFYNQTLNSCPSQTSMAATNMFEPGWILIGFIEDRLGDPKLLNAARLKPIPILYGTPNFPIFYNQTLNSSPSQTSMAATNMFEPGWILIDFIEDRLRDPKLFKPARLKPIPIFYGTPNFPIFYNQTLNSCPSQTSMAATNMFEPGWILIGFIEDRLGDPKQFDPARLKPIPFYMGRQNSLYSIIRH